MSKQDNPSSRLHTRLFIAGVLTLTAPIIFAESSEAEGVKITSTPLPDPLEAGWQGNPVCEKLHQDELQRVLRCQFAPGVGHEKHYHRRHFGYALSGGKMRITDASGTREVKLETASNYASPGTEWHQVVNIGETTVTYLIVEPLTD
jgi:quercetin dioxygenase-like cupin family protein